MSDDPREPVPVWRRQYPTWALELVSDRQVDSLPPPMLWVKVIQRVDAAGRAARNVARALFFVAPAKGSTFPLSQRNLTDDLGASRNYAAANLDRLVELGFLAVQEGSGPKPNRYTLTLPAVNPDELVAHSVSNKTEAGEELVAHRMSTTGSQNEPLVAHSVNHIERESAESEPALARARSSSPDDGAVPPLMAAPDDASPRPHLTVVTDDGSRPESVDPFEDDAAHEQVRKSTQATRDAIRHRVSPETRAREIAAEEVRRRQEREDAEEPSPVEATPGGAA